MKRKIVAVLMMFTGIVVLSYPTLAEEYYDYQQQKLVQEWQQSLQSIHNGEDDASPAQAESVEAIDPSYDVGNLEEGNENDTASESKEKVLPDFKSNPNMEGILVIDKIDLALPILHGATDKNMKTTVASIEHTGKAGEIGNYAIAGHRNYTFGRNFNRLDEMQTGDNIEIDDGERLYSYTVTEKLIVKPEDVWVLEGNGSDMEITLITCHPMENPTHRLIVKGKIIRE